MHKNHSQLDNLLCYLRKNNHNRARFIPNENFEANLFKSYNQLLEKQGNVMILGITFKKEILDQLTKFYSEVLPEFMEISKSEDITNVKAIFNTNPEPLKKYPKIPEDDDLKIIAGYCESRCSGYKYLISEDEHFWGYSELIDTNFKIKVVKEWESHRLIGN